MKNGIDFGTVGKKMIETLYFLQAGSLDFRGQKPIEILTNRI